MQVEQLVREHQEALRASRAAGRRRSPGRRATVGVARSGVQTLGVGLVRLGLRLAGPDSRLRVPVSNGAGLAEFHS